MCTLPPEIHYLIIDNLVQPPDDLSSKSALLQCMPVSREFYAYTRTIVFSRCRLTIRDKDVLNYRGWFPKSPLIERFAKFLLDKPAASNLQPLISTVRSLEIVAVLSEGAKHISLLGNRINTPSFISLLQAFIDRDAQIDCFSFDVMTEHEDIKLDWSRHVAKKGPFADLFEQLTKTKVRDLRLHGIRNLPNTLIHNFSSVKHLTLQRVVLLDGRKPFGDPLLRENIETVFNPTALDLQSTSTDAIEYPYAILHFLFPGSILKLPDNQYTKPRFPYLREFRLHWSVIKGLELLGAIYQNSPQLEVVHAIRPHFYHSTEPPYHGWTALRPPTTLRSFKLIAFIVVEQTYGTTNASRWPNLRAFLETLIPLPNMTHIDIQIQFTRSAPTAQRYWIFDHPVTRSMWGEIAMALANCATVKDLSVEIIVGKEFDAERHARLEPEDIPPRGEEETILIETCLYEAFKPMFAAKPSAKFQIRFVR